MYYAGLQFVRQHWEPNKVHVTKILGGDAAIRQNSWTVCWADRGLALEYMQQPNFLLFWNIITKAQIILCQYYFFWIHDV